MGLFGKITGGRVGGGRAGGKVFWDAKVEIDSGRGRNVLAGAAGLEALELVEGSI
jgi:hypothetical protein